MEVEWRGRNGRGRGGKKRTRSRLQRVQYDSGQVGSAERERISCKAKLRHGNTMLTEDARWLVEQLDQWIIEVHPMRSLEMILKFAFRS